MAGVLSPSVGLAGSTALPCQLAVHLPRAWVNRLCCGESGGQAGRAGLPRVKSMAPNFPRPKSIAAMELTGGLPAGWAQAVEEETGDTYYYHEETGETQWEFPMAPRLAPGAPPSTTMHSNPINS